MMREIRKRLEKLEAARKAERPYIASGERNIEKNALGRLSDADSGLFQRGKNDGLKDTQDYKDMMVRFEIAYAAASAELGIPYCNASDRGWL